MRYAASIEAFEQVPLSFKSARLRRRTVCGVPAPTAGCAPRSPATSSRGAPCSPACATAEYRERVSQGRAGVAEADAGADQGARRSRSREDALRRRQPDQARSRCGAGDRSTRRSARQAAARADLELAAIALRDCALVAPAAGILMERKVEAGALVGSGSVGFVLGDISAVKARFGIPDAMIPALALGRAIDLTVEAIAGARVHRPRHRDRAGRRCAEPRVRRRGRRSRTRTAGCGPA